MEKFYKQVIDESPFGYSYHKIVCDEHGIPVDYVFIEVNPAFEKYTGLKAKDIIGLNVTQVLPGIEKSEFDWIRVYGEIALNDGKADFEAFSEQLDQWYNIHVYSPEKGYFVTKFQNITKQVEMFDMISQQQKEILNGLQEGVIVYDLNLKYQVWNPYMEKISGMEAKDVIGRHPADLFPSFLEESGVLATLEELLRENKTVTHKFPFNVFQSGKTGWALDTSCQMKNSKGETIGILAFVRDITENVKQEDMMKQIENRYRSIFEFAPLGIANTTADGNFLDVNDTFCNILGYSKAELQSKNFTDITYKEDQPASQKGVSRMKEGTLPIFKIRKRYIHKDGSLIWVDLSSKLISDSEGNALYFITMITDITEQLKTENMLLESEDRFKMLFEKAPLGYQSLDIDGCFLEVNQQWLTMLGYDREEVVGKWFGDFLCPPYQDGFRKRFPIFKAQGYIHSEFEMLHKNGDKLFVAFDGKIGTDEKGEFKQTHCILKDITMEQRLERELEQNRELMKSLIDNTTDAIYVKDKAGKYLLFNKAAEEITGKKEADVLGNDDTNLFPLEEAMVVMAGDRNVMEGKRAVTYEERVTDSNGQLLTFSSTKGPIFNKKAELVGLFGIARDITVSRGVQEKLRQSIAEQQLLLHNLQAGVVIHAADTSILTCNPIAEEILEHSLAQMQGKQDSDPCWRFVSEDGTPLEQDEYPVNRVCNNKRDIAPFILGVERLERRDRKWLLVNGYPLFDKNAQMEKVVISFVDVTETKQKEKELERQQALLKEMEKAAKIGGFQFNVQTQMQEWTEETFRILEIDTSQEEPMLPEGMEFIAPAYRDMAAQGIERAINFQEPYDQEWEVITEKGNRRWVQSIGYPVVTDGIVTHVRGSLQDITDRKEAENALKNSEHKYRLIAENAADVISIFNLSKDEFTYISPSVEKLRGLTVDEAMKESLEDICTPYSYKILKAAIAENVEDFISNPRAYNHYTSELQHRCKNGDIVWVEVSTSYQYNSSGELEATNITRNIEERKKAEKDLINLSYYDQLTGLYNRRFYEEELKRLDTERNLPIALIMADVNGLKLTNDAFGHQQGDRLLQIIAQILRDECRSDEIVSRIGGDEFVILLPETSAQGARALIDRINVAVAKEMEKNSILSLSMGYAVKETMKAGMDATFKEAEDDMYRHKLTESSSMRSQSIDLIMNSLYAKSRREMHHSNRVGDLCHVIATNMNFDQEEIKQLRIAGLVHDIGKIGISNLILDKEGTLTEEEWHEIKKHSEIGYRILSSVNEFSEIAEFVLAHQERWDGKGYPKALKGESIPIQARIISIADAYDAMTSNRTYRNKLDEEAAILEIKRNAGTQFDPEIARVFVELVMGKSWE